MSLTGARYPDVDAAELASQSFSAEIVEPLKRHWVAILATGLVFGLLALIWQIRAVPLYSAYAVVAPTDGASDPARANLGGLSSLAGAAGISLGASDEAVSPYTQFKFLLTSPELAYYQVSRRPMLQMVFSGSWDPATRQWRRPTGVGAAVSGLFNPLFGLPTWLPPSAEALAGTYGGNLKLQSVPDSSMMRLIYSDSDPQRAQMILTYMLDDANELLRQQARRDARAQASYLRERLSQTDMQSYRETLVGLLAEQEQRLMLTNGQLPFAARTVERITVSQGPTSKRPMLYASIATIIGFCLGYFVAIVVHNRRRIVPDGEAV